MRLHLPLVDHCARRFINRGEPLDDLVQVGTIGLIKSVDRFDSDRGVEFSTYATPTILGEIKRYFRDKGWAIRVPRRLQELRMSIGAVTGEMAQDLGRSPTPREIAEKLGVTVEEVMEGIESANAYSTLSLDAGDNEDGSSSSMLDTLGMDDEALAHVEIRESIKPLIEQLPNREKRILMLQILPRDDPVPDRGGDRGLADARLTPAEPHPGRAADVPGRGQLARSRASIERGWSSPASTSAAITASTIATGSVSPVLKFQARPSQIS